jgi:hypothetical protein
VVETASLAARVRWQKEPELMAAPVFTSKRRGTPPAPPPIVFPTRPEDAGGTLRELWRSYRSRETQASALRDQLGKLRRQLDDLQRVVSSATPASDFAQVAAAEAGARIVKLAIDRLEPTVQSASAAASGAGQTHAAAWSRLMVLKRVVLDGEFILDNEGKAPTEAALRSELSRLAGITIEGG